MRPYRAWLASRSIKVRDSHLARREALTAVNALAEPLTVEELLPPIPDKPPVTRPVLEGQHLVGIITERDLTAALAEGADAVLTPVSDYMTPAPEVLQPDNELADAAHLMLELGIRHLPIVRSGQLVGVLSMRDVLDADTYGGDGTGSTTGRVPA